MNTVNVGKTTMAFEVELLHRDLPKEIIDSAYKVHNALGCGLLEKVYGNALVWDIELKENRGCFSKRVQGPLSR
jgi:hypothetical protein